MNSYHEEHIDCMMADHNKEVPISPVLPKTIRTSIWSITKALKAEQQGLAIAAQACVIFERFSRSKIETYVHSGSGEGWEVITGSKSVFVHMATCIQLATKMTSAAHSLKLKDLQESLAFLNATVDDYRTSEMEVLKFINYKLPLWSHIDIIRMLATHFNASQTVHDQLHTVVDYAVFRLDFITEEMEDVVVKTSKRTQTRIEIEGIKTLHLMAASLLVSAHLNKDQNLKFKEGHLSTFVKAPLCYIQCMRDIMITDIARPRRKTPLKRS